MQLSEQFHALSPPPKATTRKETDHLPKRKCLAVIPGLGTKNEIQLPCYETKLFSFSPTKGRSFIWRQERLLTMVVPNRNYELKTIIIIYQAVRRFHIFLRPLNTYSIFFLHSSLSFQSSSTSPFSPISPRIPSAQVSLGHLVSFFLLGSIS